MKKSDKIFLIPIIILTTNWIYRLVDFTNLINYFPLDKTNDISSYMTLVYFYDKYGFLANVPDWFNGFTLFETYPPGWIIFVEQFYKLFGNILVATYVSTITLFVFAFIGIWLIGRELKLSTIKRVAFFLFVFANPMMIGAVLKQGRMPSFMALVIFVYIVYVALYFKDRPINWKILGIGILYTILILTHQPETILAGIFLIGLILVKKGSERLAVIGSILLGICASSFWLIQFIKNVFATNFLEIGFSSWILEFDGEFLLNNLIGIAIALGLLIVFFLKWQEEKNKRVLIFYGPILILCVLFLTRIVAFIPIIKEVYPDPYNDFFLFFLSLFLISLKFNKISKSTKIIIALGLTVLAIAGVTYNHFYTPYFVKHTPQDQEFFDIIPLIEGKFFFVTTEPLDSYGQAYYGYTSIYYDKYAISGWGSMFKDYEYSRKLREYSTKYIYNNNCEEFIPLLEEYNTTEVLTYTQDCSFLTNKCGLTTIATSGKACLLKMPNTSN